jgi:hypothetical protein
MREVKMGRLYAEPTSPQLGDYWHTQTGWAAYLPGGVVEMQESDAHEEGGSLVATAPSVVDRWGRVLCAPTA